MLVQNIKKSITHLFFPHNCLGCSSDVLDDKELLCAQCLNHLPYTQFLEKSNNPIDKIFYGRIPIQQAGACFYFTKDSVIQLLMVQLKYRGNKDAGYFLGKLLGYQLAKSAHFSNIDVIIPLPLNAVKEYKRGYNQALIICEGIVSVWDKPILNHIVERIVFTSTQTHENRENRWKNMKDVFKVAQPDQLKNKHILLIDDVITTGATLEACAASILEIDGTLLSIATVAYTL